MDTVNIFAFVQIINEVKLVDFKEKEREGERRKWEMGINW